MGRADAQSSGQPLQGHCHRWPSILPCSALPTPHSCFLGSSSQINVHEAFVSGSYSDHIQIIFSLGQSCNLHGKETIIISVPKGRNLGLGKADDLQDHTGKGRSTEAFGKKGGCVVLLKGAGAWLCQGTEQGVWQYCVSAEVGGHEFDVKLVSQVVASFPATLRC